MAANNVKILRVKNDGERLIIQVNYFSHKFFAYLKLEGLQLRTVGLEDSKLKKSFPVDLLEKLKDEKHIE